jgi:2-C-methyl-D-erythritol 2,4-cyclodiphosphate synthase
MKDCNYRIGYGFDIHKFEKGRKLILGGIEIPYKLGLQGHSDADVLLHSICDALLGAAGLEDIGHQFPNTELKYKNISSLILLEGSYKLISQKGWRVANVDSMITLEEPKIYKYRQQMKDNISSIIKTKNVSIKATTSEGLGFVGDKKGCISSSVALLYKE